MKQDREKILETRIDSELKALGELTAPGTLAPRVMRAIERRTQQAWHRRAWDSWPLLPRAASFGALAAFFAGCCLLIWQVVYGGAGQGSGAFLGEQFSVVTTLWRTAGVIFEAMTLAFSQVRVSMVLPVIALFIAAWLAVVGLGSVYVRLAVQPVSEGRER